MITPIRGRKQLDRLFLLLFVELEMITPIRGRKRSMFKFNIVSFSIRNDNPDKGTETY